VSSRSRISQLTSIHDNTKPTTGSAIVRDKGSKTLLFHLIHPDFSHIDKTKANLSAIKHHTPILVPLPHHPPPLKIFTKAPLQFLGLTYPDFALAQKQTK